MLGRKTPSLASPRSRTTISHAIHPPTTNPRQPSGESARKSAKGADSTQAARTRLKLAAGECYTWMPLVAKPPYHANEHDQIAAIHAACRCECARWP